MLIPLVFKYDVLVSASFRSFEIIQVLAVRPSYTKIIAAFKAERSLPLIIFIRARIVLVKTI